MRREFNTFVDLYHGPSTATPGVLRVSNVHCRIVPDECFQEPTNPLHLSEAYITMDSVEPIGPQWTETAPGIWEVDLGKADDITLHDGGVMLWSVVRVELRTWMEGADYWRAHVAPWAEIPAGCESYFWNGIQMMRVGPLRWEDSGPETILTTDGLGTWELTDVADDLHYTVDLWDGEGCMTFTQVEDQEVTIEVCCGDA